MSAAHTLRPTIASTALSNHYAFSGNSAKPGAIQHSQANERIWAKAPSLRQQDRSLRGDARGSARKGRKRVDAHC